MRSSWQAIVFVAMLLAALFWLRPYALKRWQRDTTKAQLPVWRRIAANIGLLAVGAQIILFIVSSWISIGSDYLLFGQWARWVVPTFIVAFSCVLAGKGSTRWWLLSSSVIMFVICFFIVLSA